MVIADKYFKLLGKTVYNPELDKFGRISGIDLSVRSLGPYLTYKLHYDNFDDEIPMYFDDLKFKIKFVITTNINQEDFRIIKDKTIKDLQEAFGEEFNNSMIMYIPLKEMEEAYKESKERGLIERRKENNDRK